MVSVALSSTLSNPNWFIRLAYDGTAYSGWQIQPDNDTVQGQLRSALSQLYQRSDFELFGSSRTDAGVHALDQCVTFRPSAAPAIPGEGIRKSLSNSVPIDIRIQTVDLMPETFHVRHSNFGKAYTYLIHRGRLNTPFLGRYVWSTAWNPDITLMETAARQMLGELDFAAFTVKLANQDIKSTMRCLNSITFREYGPILAVTIVGSSFLYKMVRCIIGCLMEVGRGNISPDAVAQMITSGSRGDIAFKTAPPQGLFLERVFFEESGLDYEPETLPYLQLL